MREGYAVHVFAETDVVSADDVVAMWLSEGVLDEAEARSRVEEVFLVATGHGELAAVTTAHLRRPPRLGVDLWDTRVYVAKEHRLADLMFHLAVHGLAHLEQRYVAGLDVRGAGVIYESENPTFSRLHNETVWPWVDAPFMGLSDRGDPVYVHWFPGATVPSDPPRA